jgi:hypothetical protein
MLLILKIPIIYLCVVVWYAVRAKPEPPQSVATVAPADEQDSGPGGSRRWRRVPRRPRVGPHGTPIRVGRARATRATAERR